MFYKNILHNKVRLTVFFFASQTRGAKKWYPDQEFMDQFSGPVMYPDEVTSQWKVPPWNSEFNLIDLPNPIFKYVFF